jgi:hypothetical protein
LKEQIKIHESILGCTRKMAAISTSAPRIVSVLARIGGTILVQGINPLKTSINSAQKLCFGALWQGLKLEIVAVRKIDHGNPAFWGGNPVQLS